MRVLEPSSGFPLLSCCTLRLRQDIRQGFAYTDTRVALGRVLGVAGEVQLRWRRVGEQILRQWLLLDDRRRHVGQFLTRRNSSCDRRGGGNLNLSAGGVLDVAAE